MRHLLSNLCIITISGVPGGKLAGVVKVLLHKVTVSHINERIDMVVAYPITPHKAEVQGGRQKTERQTIKKHNCSECSPILLYMVSVIANMQAVKVLLHMVTLSHINERIDMAALANPTCWPSYHPSSTSRAAQ